MPSLIVGSTPRGDDYFGQDESHSHLVVTGSQSHSGALIPVRSFGETRYAVPAFFTSQQ